VREFLKIIGGIVLGVATAALIAFNVLLLWVATGPRSLDKLSPYIAASLSNSGFTVQIGETWLVWDGWKHPIDIRLQQVTVLTKQGQVFSRFPEISLGVDVLSLPMGRIIPTSLTINHPVISLFQNEDHSISFGMNQQTAASPPEGDSTIPFSAALLPLLAPKPGDTLRKMHYITIVDADVSVGNHSGMFFKASNVNFIFRRNWQDALHISTSANIAYGNYQSMVFADFDMEKGTPVINGNVRVSKMMPGTLAALFSDNSLLNALKLPVSGQANVTMDMTGELQKLDFAIEGGQGSIDSPRQDGALPVKSLIIQGDATHNLRNVHITRLSADFNGMLLNANAVVDVDQINSGVHGSATLRNVPASDVHLLWPPEVSPESRKWVTDNITEGRVPLAEVTVAIAPGDLSKPNLPKVDVMASIALEGAKVRYLPDHPEVRDLKGTVHVDAVSLDADIVSGEYMRDTKLTGGKLVMADLNADNPYIKLNFTVESSARDIVRVLGLPRLKHAAKLGLSEDTASGSVKGSAALGFHFFSPPVDKDHPASDESDIDYDVTAELKNVAQPGFMKKFDITNANGVLTVKSTGLEYKGKADVNGASVSDGDVRYLFKPDEGFDTFIDVTASAPVDSFPRFGYPRFPFLDGTLGVKASVKQGDNAELSQAQLDLAHATVSFPEYGWVKKNGMPGSFEMKAEKKEGVVRISSFHLTAGDMDTTGSIDLNKALEVQRISMAPLRFGQTDLTRMVYEVIDGGLRIDASGHSGDMSAWLAPDATKDSSFSFEHFPALQLKAQMDTLILGKGRALSDVKADVSCSAERCAHADVSAKTADGKAFTFHIGPNGKGIRQLSVHAGNGGALLKACNIFDGMEGGELNLTGVYGLNGLAGTLDIGEHTVRNAPILARILSVASLTGFFDTLQGNGIRFVSLHAPFTLKGDVITIEEAKTHGPAMGMTASGTVTFPKHALDLNGTIIPSYTLNNVLGKVPVLGNALNGGEGQGLFAARYSVRGSDKNPQVSVNPLSMLTPGFLRGVFDIFDGKPKKNED
jgi:hypothetical protein